MYLLILHNLQVLKFKAYTFVPTFNTPMKSQTQNDTVKTSISWLITPIEISRTCYFLCVCSLNMLRHAADGWGDGKQSANLCVDLLGQNTDWSWLWLRGKNTSLETNVRIRGRHFNALILICFCLMLLNPEYELLERFLTYFKPIKPCCSARSFIKYKPHANNIHTVDFQVLNDWEACIHLSYSQYLFPL